ncbi:CoA transferase [Novosphingobium colocasiae]
MEPHFHARLLRLLEIDPANFPPQYERARWPEARALLEQAFVRRSRAAWCALLEGTDACFAPVLTLDEAPSHPHMMARGVYRERDGRVEAQPAPRFSRTPGAAGDAVCGDSDAVAALLERWGGWAFRVERPETPKPLAPRWAHPAATIFACGSASLAPLP